MSILGLICARGGSKGVPKKNIKKLAGKPLIAYSILASLKSKYIDRTIVSTDDKEIARISRKYGAEIIDRPKELARDTTPTMPVIRHAVSYLRKHEGMVPDFVVLLQPTSPLRKAEDIDNAIKKMKSTKADLVVSVSEVKQTPYWSFSVKKDRIVPLFKKGFRIKRRQDLPKIYALNGAVYVMTPKVLKKKNMFSGKVRAIVMPEERSMDIDSMLDLRIAELIIKGK